MEKKLQSKTMAPDTVLSAAINVKRAIGVTLIFQGIYAEPPSASSTSGFDIHSRPIKLFTLQQFFYDKRLISRIKAGIEAISQSPNKGAILYNIMQEEGLLGNGYSIRVDVQGAENFKKITKALCPKGGQYFSINEVKQGIGGDLISYEELLLALKHCLSLASTCEVRQVK